MNTQDLARATRAALLLDDTSFDIDFSLRLAHADGRTAHVSVLELMEGRFEFYLKAGDTVCYASAEEVVSAGWRILPAPPIEVIDDAGCAVISDRELLRSPHLDRELPCTISLQIRNRDVADARLSITLIIAPMLSVGLRFRFDREVTLMGSDGVDPAIVTIAARWVRRNHKVLRTICGGDFDLARDVLGIDLEDGHAWKADLGVHEADPAESVIAEAVARNREGRQKTLVDFDIDAWRRESKRQAIIAAHRKRYALGVVKGVPGIVH